MKITKKFNENIVQTTGLFKILTIFGEYCQVWSFWPPFPIFAYFGTFLVILSKCGHFWVFLAILVNIGHFWQFLSDIGYFWWFWLFSLFFTIFGDLGHPRARWVRVAGSITNIYEFHIWHMVPPHVYIGLRWNKLCP